MFGRIDIALDGEDLGSDLFDRFIRNADHGPVVFKKNVL
jgi:hypothetical protein